MTELILSPNVFSSKTDNPRGGGHSFGQRLYRSQLPCAKLKLLNSLYSQLVQSQSACNSILGDWVAYGDKHVNNGLHREQ